MLLALGLHIRFYADDRVWSYAAAAEFFDNFWVLPYLWLSLPKGSKGLDYYTQRIRVMRGGW